MKNKGRGLEGGRAFSASLHYSSCSGFLWCTNQSVSGNVCLFCKVLDPLSDNTVHCESPEEEDVRRERKHMR